MWRLCAAVLVLQLPISEGKSDEPKYDYSYDEPDTQKGVILHGVVALIHEKAYERGLEHYRYDEQEL